jgi:hypothetical protein
LAYQEQLHKTSRSDEKKKEEWKPFPTTKKFYNRIQREMK